MRLMEFGMEGLNKKFYFLKKKIKKKNSFKKWQITTYQL